MMLERLRLEGGHFRTPAGERVYLIGANFWPSKTGPFMYRDPWNPAAVGKDLDQLAARGANCARVFCFWPDFMPTPDAVSEDAIARLDQLIDLCAQRRMWSIPTFLVGHMSGENWDPPWRDGRDLYADDFMRRAQERLVRTIASKYKGDSRIAAWLLTNEWPLYAGPTTSERGIAWAQRLCAVVREADPGRAVSLGDGAWELVLGQSTGLAARHLAPIVDFVGPHFYPKETDSLRHSLVASFSMRMAAPLKLPVLLEEFGCSSDQASDENAAGYYRTTLWSAFGAGNCGALAWNSHDFDLPYRRPYSHHPYELHFGLIRSDGSRKPQADEFARFAKYATTHAADEWQLQPPDVAIVRTSFFLQSFPFDWGWTTTELRDLYLQTYALCVKAGMNARFVDLSALPDSVDAPPQDVTREPSAERLWIMPCMQQLTTQNAAELEAFAQAGGTVYVSFGGEPWHGNLRQFIGARPRIRYGLVETPEQSEVTLRFARRFGEFAKGDTIAIPVRGELQRSAPLVCEPESAEVIASDDAGRPALLRRQAGKGSVIFCAYPVEYYLLTGANSNSGDDTWRLFRALFQCSGVAASPAEPAPGLQSFVWHHRREQARRQVLLINHADASVKTGFENSPRIKDAESGAVVKAGRIELGPKSVRIFDITPAD